MVSVMYEDQSGVVRLLIFSDRASAEESVEERAYDLQKRMEAKGIRCYKETFNPGKNGNMVTRVASHSNDEWAAWTIYQEDCRW